MDALLVAENQIYDALAHGDDEHRIWLKEAIHSILYGGQVPPVRQSKRLSNFGMIKEFVETFDASHDPALWRKLIQEELDELDEAMEAQDSVAAFDAVCDLLYVVYGFGHSKGFPIDEGYAEVHRSNMTKLGPDGKPIYREDGKIIKGPNFEAPMLKEILEKNES